MEHRTGGKTAVYLFGAVLLILILAVVMGIMTGFLPVRESARQPEAETVVTPPPVNDLVTPPPTEPVIPSRVCHLVKT